MRAEFAAAAEARKRAGEDEEGGPAKRSKAEPLSEEVMAVLNEVRLGQSVSGSQQQRAGARHDSHSQ